LEHSTLLLNTILGAAADFSKEIKTRFMGGLGDSIKVKKKNYKIK